MRAAATLLLVALVWGADAQADDARPLTLTLVEVARDTYDVRFQTPMRGNARLRVALRLPDGASVVAATLDRRAAGDSLIERFTFELDGGLIGRSVGIEGLALGSRNALLTVRLLDGRVLRVVLGGYRPTYTVEELPSEERSHGTADLGEAARAGFAHGVTRPAHVLLAVALILAFVGTPAFGTWILALGAFLVTAVLGGWLGPVEGFTIDLAEALLALVAALAAREALLGRQRHLVFLTLVAGLAYGVAEPAGAAGAASPSFLVLLASGLGLDLAHLAIGGATLLVLYVLRLPSFARSLTWIVGVVAVFTAFHLAVQPEAGAAPTPSAALPMPVALDDAATGGAGTLAARGLVTDVETYLDVGVFETRLEVLGRFEVLESWFGVGWGGGEMIEVDAQPALLERAAGRLHERLTVTIDGEAAVPDATRRGFATQDATGTYLRDEPVGEPSAEALVGITYAFRTPAIPRDVEITWSSFPAGLSEMRARVIDPEISREVVVRPDAPTLAWTNQLSEDPLPPVAAIRVRTPPAPLPILSLLLAVAALVGSAWLFARAWRPLANATLRIGLALAFLATPWLTTDVSAWFPSSAEPTAREARAITQALLENVYRAFNVRDESAVYDRLALSLADGTREAAYLENRRALAFERVGGARTHVDAVELTDLEDMRPDEGGGFEANATWTVAGSVTHFGHRHLRKNAYRARLGIVPTGGTWRITHFTIEALERRR